MQANRLRQKRPLIRLYRYNPLSAPRWYTSSTEKRVLVVIISSDRKVQICLGETDRETETYRQTDRERQTDRQRQRGREREENAGEKPNSTLLTNLQTHRRISFKTSVLPPPPPPTYSPTHRPRQCEKECIQRDMTTGMVTAEGYHQRNGKQR